MSYRSIKRVLGETSLERKCRFLFGTCLLVLITGSFWWYGKLTEDEIDRANFRNSHALTESALLSDHLKFFAQDNNNPNRNILSTKPQGNASATNQDFRNQLTKEFKSQEYNWEYIVPLNIKIDPPSKKGEPLDTIPKKHPEDEFERNLLKLWNQPIPLNSKSNGSKPQEGKNTTNSENDISALNDNHSIDLDKLEAKARKEIGSDGQVEYQYYEAVRGKEMCIDCHRAFGLTSSVLDSKSESQTSTLSEGDLIAVIKITKSYSPTQKALNRNRAILLATAIITVFVAMIALYVIVRYVIVKPLAHLRDVSDAISTGNIEQRVELHTGDEFEEVGSAFNRMMQHLVSAHDELRDVNQDLDRKFDQLAQANMRLHEMNRLKNDFLATMSHELRTPLNSIIGFSDVLSTIEGLNDKQRKFVSNIQTSGRMLLEMINDILDLAKIDSGRMDVRLSDFRIDAIVTAPCDMARPLAEKKNIDLEVQIDGDIPQLHQDSAKIQQILNNLLSNAIKFTPEGGQIRVVASRHENQFVKIVVSDTGVGIAQEDQSHVFEKFRQGTTVLAGGDAMTREYSGTGLGLSIVKELCKLLGGEIQLKSDLGRGSTFIVKIPVRLQRQPRLDSPLNESVDELTKPRRIDFQRVIDSSPPTGDVDKDGDESQELSSTQATAPEPTSPEPTPSTNVNSA